MSNDSDAERKKDQRLKLLDDHIGRKLAEAEKSGELRTAPSFGKPLDLGDGYEETPAELRMSMKILKDAGVVPREVEVMREIGALLTELQRTIDPDAALVLQKRIAEKRQVLALRLEQLRKNSAL